jgi:hypothetical protein
MVKVYALLFVIAIVGGTGYVAYSEYKDMQQRIGVLRENNAKLESALQTSEASINNLQKTMESLAEANRTLQADLQKAEQYGDELQKKLREHDLTALALKKPGLLEGTMNDATANLWRDLERDTGGNPDNTLPKWLQSDTKTRDTSGNRDEGGEGADSNGSATKTSRTN